MTQDERQDQTAEPASGSAPASAEAATKAPSSLKYLFRDLREGFYVFSLALAAWAWGRMKSDNKLWVKVLQVAAAALIYIGIGWGLILLVRAPFRTTVTSVRPAVYTVADLESIFKAQPQLLNQFKTAHKDVAPALAADLNMKVDVVKLDEKNEQHPQEYSYTFPGGKKYTLSFLKSVRGQIVVKTPDSGDQEIPNKGVVTVAGQPAGLVIFDVDGHPGAGLASGQIYYIHPK